MSINLQTLHVWSGWRHWSFCTRKTLDWPFLYSASFCFRADSLRFSRMRLWRISSDGVSTRRILTPSLPWCRLKTTNTNLKPLSFLPSFSHRHVKGFLSKRIYSTESRCAIGPASKLFEGTCVQLSARIFYMLGQWRGSISTEVH